MASNEEMRENVLVGRDIVSGDGLLIGHVEDVIVDRGSGQRFLRVTADGKALKGAAGKLVPISGRTVDGPVTVPFSADLIQRAPIVVVPGGHLTTSDVRRIEAHFGLDGTADEEYREMSPPGPYAGDDDEPPWDRGVQDD
jgi:sporulation protein YlmC with PRC-barrel domain